MVEWPKIRSTTMKRRIGGGEILFSQRTQTLHKNMSLW